MFNNLYSISSSFDTIWRHLQLTEKGRKRLLLKAKLFLPTALLDLGVTPRFMVWVSKPIHPMRNLISILLALSLSWITTGYACQMDGLNMVRAMCCCKHGHQEHQAKREDSSSAKVGADKARCCDVVSSSSLGDQQPGAIAKVPSLDLPAFTILPVTMWVVAEPTPRLLSAPPPARGPPAGTGTRTYLTTARLRL